MADTQIPEDRRYTNDHEWVASIGEANRLRLGITDFAQDALGDVVYCSLPPVGQRVNAGDSIGEVESTKSVSELYCPVDGEVTQVNSALEERPELINEDPYGEGWIVEIESNDDLGALMDAAGYQALVNP